MAYASGRCRDHRPARLGPGSTRRRRPAARRRARTRRRRRGARARATGPSSSRWASSASPPALSTSGSTAPSSSPCRWPPGPAPPGRTSSRARWKQPPAKTSSPPLGLLVTATGTTLMPVPAATSWRRRLPVAPPSLSSASEVKDSLAPRPAARSPSGPASAPVFSPSPARWSTSSTRAASPASVATFSPATSTDYAAGHRRRRTRRASSGLSTSRQEQGGPGFLALWWKCPHLGCTVPWRDDLHLRRPGDRRQDKQRLVPLPLPRLHL